jgi:hypothetical protein
VIVLRGDLTAILTFASGKRKPEFLNERAILEELWTVPVLNTRNTKAAPEGGLC